MIGEHTIEAIEHELVAACRRRVRVEAARVPRLSSGIPTLAVLILISVAVAVPLLALHPSRTVAPGSAVGYSPAPTAPTPAAIRAAAAACDRLGARITGRRVLAAARGRYTALIFRSSKSDRVCISDGHSGDGSTSVGFDALWRFYVGPDQLGEVGGGGGSAPGFPSSARANHAVLGRMTPARQERHLYGLAGTDISAVTFVFAKGVKVGATIQHGWYFAWWPSSDLPTSVRVTTKTGTVITSRMPWAGGCRPGTTGCLFGAIRALPGGGRHGGPPQLIPTRVTAHFGAGTYRDPAGWTIQIPRGWQVTRFKETKTRVPVAGAQISNGPLRAPFVLPGYPLQVRSQDLPPEGRIGLIIGNALGSTRSRTRVANPPLPRFDRRNGYWVAYSTIGDGIESLWFRVHGTTFIATVTFDSGAIPTPTGVAARIIHSLRVVPVRS